MLSLQTYEGVLISVEWLTAVHAASLRMRLLLWTSGWAQN